MALTVEDDYLSSLPQLRYFSTPRRVRAEAFGRVLVESGSARLVWEPGRVVPQYAVPVAALRGELSDSSAAVPDARPVTFLGVEALDPSTPFGVHSCPGRSMRLRAPGGDLDGAVFLPADPDLDGWAVLDFEAFDTWFEEDEVIFGHARDPRSRVEVRRSARHVVVEVNGTVVADSRRPVLVMETFLPTRFYLPREDVAMRLLRPSSTRSTCAYKGHASYLSVDLGADLHQDLAWTYEDPVAEVGKIAGLIAFLDERVDVTVDGEHQPRPRSPWS
ncbi:DUF427 domain-containing protein [Kribbella sindirgiensis]|uniref:DUF427 domain-containing protein n=1 Tax=Kribbella sindirgiensis TaxID=1124744 RepID=A0A4R0ITR5_9ACTN|nr:DUF427 domain-containing protein [Kribbella sindirgiensis]TCC34906.1 DUF427 domain-containing protein [Kribbella sindirgiensis]